MLAGIPLLKDNGIKASGLPCFLPHGDDALLFGGINLGRRIVVGADRADTIRDINAAVGLNELVPDGCHSRHVLDAVQVINRITVLL